MRAVIHCVRAAFMITAGLLATVAVMATPLGTTFTYQGQLKQNNAGITGTADFQFSLFDAASAGAQVGTTLTVPLVNVSTGLFSVDLDFGANAFDGQSRFMQIAVRYPSGGGAYTPLTPRQAVLAAPYSLFAKSTGSVVNTALTGTYTNPLSFTNIGNAFTGSGVGLTGLNASNIASGTLSSARLSGTYTNALTLNNAANSYAGNGAGLTSLNAGNISAGTLASARLPTGGAWSLASILNLDSNLLMVDPVNDRVGIGTATPFRRLDVLDTSAGFLTYPLKVTNAAGTAGTAVGILFHVEDNSVSRGKGAIVYERSGTWNRGDMHFLQNSIGNNTIADLPDAKMTITNLGNVGIGNTAPGTRLQVDDAAVDLAAAWFRHTNATGINYGVKGETNAGLYSAGVYGVATSSAGFSRGMEGITAANQGVGVIGTASHTTGGNYGVAGLSNSSAGKGVYGEATAASGTNFGVHGKVTSTSGYAGYFEGRGYFSSNLGVGTNVPATRVHVMGGTDTDLSGGGYVVTGSTTGLNLSMDDNEIMARNNGATATLLLNNNGGDVSISPGGTGRLIAKVVQLTGADLAEKFPMSDQVEPGLIVAIDSKNPGHLCLARGEYNKCVAGVISGANGLPAGAILGDLTGADAPAVALSGRVWVWSDASFGPIAPGDMLTTSATPGYAMKAVDRERSQGAIIGKAMTSLESDRGFVLVLVNLQ